MQLRTDPLKVLHDRLPGNDFVEVPRLSPQEVRAVAIALLRDHGKALEPAQLHAIEGLEPARDPLYLIVLLRELRAMPGSQLHERISKAIEAAPTVRTSGALFEAMMERLEDFLGKEEVANWCRSLASSRDGLSPAVLAQILEARYRDRGGRVSHRIRRAMRAYLQTRNGRTSFFHRELADAARRCYVPTDAQATRVVHAEIASALQSVWIQRRDVYAEAERLYHLVEAEDWDGALAALRDNAPLETRLAQPGGARRFTLDVDFAHERAIEKGNGRNIAAQIVSDFLALFSTAPARQAKFDFSRVNAWLLYRPNLAFLRAVLDAGARRNLDLNDLTADHRDLAFSCRSRLGNLLRRDGKLSEADEVLSSLVQLADLGTGRPPRAIGRVGVRLRGVFSRRDERASLVAYELGYVAFLRGDLRLARRWFRYADVLGRAAGDVTGAWIARCLAENCRFIGELKSRSLELTLNRAQPVFEEQASHGDPNALRWLMNVTAHRLEIAVARNDPGEARQAHAALLSDAWVREIAPPNFMSRYDALLALAENRFSDASKAFEKFLTRQAFTSDNKYEQLARHALDYGRALWGAGNKGRAREVWLQALNLPKDAGNRPWQARIRQLMNDAS
jgi:hypothetical protein